MKIIRILLIVPDILLSVISSGLFLILFLPIRYLKRNNQNETDEKKLLIIETNHSYGSIKRHGYESMILSRDLNGYYSKVITFYPILGSNPYDEVAEFDAPIFKRSISDIHDFYESKIYWSKWLKLFRMFNFVLSQINAMLFMRRLIISEKISVVRGADPFFAGLYAFLLSDVCHIPYAMRIGADYDAIFKNGIITFKKIYYSYKIEKIIAKFVFKHCDLILAANENYKRYSIVNNAREEKVKVIRYGNIIESFHFDSPADRQSPTDLPWEEKKFFIIVGRLTSVKHPEDVIYAFNNIFEQNRDKAVLFVGQGDTESELKELAVNLKINNNIIFVGNKDQKWLYKVYPKALAYLSPLTGMALVEAALAELPIIAYDYEWHSEIVKHENTGLLVNYRDIAGLSNAMQKVISNPDFSKELGKNARKLVWEMMHYDIVREKEINAYRELFKAS